MNDLTELIEIKIKMHHEVNNLRSLEHYLGQAYLENLWIVSDEKQKESLRKILKQRDKVKLINWIRRHPSISLGEKNIRQLRDDARDAYIPNYSRMNKIELLMALKNITTETEKPADLTNREMIIEMNKIIDDMASLLIEAKIKENYLFIDPEAVNFETKVIKEAFDWLQKIHDREYQKSKELKMLLPEETWKIYKSWGEDFANHREVILLNEALQLLRKTIVCSTRPDLFKNSKVKSFITKLNKEKGD